MSTALDGDLEGSSNSIGPAKAAARMAVIGGVALLASWSVLLGTLFYFVPRWKMIFSDFGVELPGMTVLWIQVSELLVAYWYAVVPGVMLCLAGLVGVGYELGKRWSRGAELALLLSSLAMTALLGGSLWWSMHSVISQLQQELS